MIAIIAYFKEINRVLSAVTASSKNRYTLSNSVTLQVILHLSKDKDFSTRCSNAEIREVMWEKCIPIDPDEGDVEEVGVEEGQTEVPGTGHVLPVVHPAVYLRHRHRLICNGTGQYHYHTFTVNSRYLEVVGTIFHKFKLPEVQINLHFG